MRKPTMNSEEYLKECEEEDKEKSMKIIEEIINQKEIDDEFIKKWKKWNRIMQLKITITENKGEKNA